MNKPNYSQDFIAPHPDEFQAGQPLFQHGQTVGIMVNENIEYGTIEGLPVSNSYGHRMYYVRMKDGELIPRIENLIYI